MPTPLVSTTQLASELGITTGLFLKREDLHPYGSHKGRSIPGMIDAQLKNGVTNFVISSSGNAALAAALYVSECNQKNPTTPLTLRIFVGKNISPEKLVSLQKIADKNISLEQTDAPKQSAFAAQKSGSGLLRQSTDNTALVGYGSLATELLAELPDLAALFIPTSSGTTAEGLFEGFANNGINPEIHIVQTDAVHPFVNSNATPTTEPSLASAIVDKIGHRKNQIEAVLTKSRGGGYVATNQDIASALRLAQKTLGFEISPNSALAIVGLQKALEQKKNWRGPVVLLITGR